MYVVSGGLPRQQTEFSAGRITVHNYRGSIITLSSTLTTKITKTRISCASIELRDIHARNLFQLRTKLKSNRFNYACL